MDHDQRFKVLLQAFIREFMQLFFPQWQANFDFTRITWLDKETFTDPPRGEHRVLDLVGRVPVLVAPSVDEPGDEWLLLLHVEIESADRAAPLRRRIFDYRTTLRLRYGLPVLSIGFFLHVHLEGIGWDVYTEEVWGEEIVRFRYPYIGLPALDGEEYLGRDNVLGAALSVLMRLPEERRLELGEQAWRRVQSEENEYKRFLLSDCVEAYAPRNEAESQAFEQRLLATSNAGERAMTTTIFERYWQKGQRDSLLRVLEKRFGPLPEEVRQRVASIPADRLNDLLDSAVTATSLGEVAWPE